VQVALVPNWVLISPRSCAASYSSARRRLTPATARGRRPVSAPPIRFQARGEVRQRPAALNWG